MVDQNFQESELASQIRLARNRLEAASQVVKHDQIRQWGVRARDQLIQAALELLHFQPVQQEARQIGGGFGRR